MSTAASPVAPEVYLLPAWTFALHGASADDVRARARAFLRGLWFVETAPSARDREELEGMPLQDTIRRYTLVEPAPEGVRTVAFALLVMPNGSESRSVFVTAHPLGRERSFALGALFRACRLALEGGWGAPPGRTDDTSLSPRAGLHPALLAGSDAPQTGDDLGDSGTPSRGVSGEAREASETQSGLLVRGVSGTQSVCGTEAASPREASGTQSAEPTRLHAPVPRRVSVAVGLSRGPGSPGGCPAGSPTGSPVESPVSAAAAPAAPAAPSGTEELRAAIRAAWAHGVEARATVAWLDRRGKSFAYARAVAPTSEAANELVNLALAAIAAPDERAKHAGLSMLGGLLCTPWICEAHNLREATIRVARWVDAPTRRLDLAAPALALAPPTRLALERRSAATLPVYPFDTSDPGVV
jgi:hypothetical protein